MLHFCLFGFKLFVSLYISYYLIKKTKFIIVLLSL